MAASVTATPVRTPPLTVPVLWLALAVAGVMDGLGWVPFVLPAVVGAIMLLTIAQRTAMSFALAATLAILLAGYAVLVRLYPLVPLSLDTKNRIALVLVGVSLLIVLSRQRLPVRLPLRPVAVPAVAALLPVALLGIVLVVVVGSSEGARASWAMHNDAIWNTVTARFVWADGGVDTALHPNASPLTAALLAAAFAVGRGAVEGVALLQHDVMREAQLWVILTTLCAALAGLIALRSLREVRAGYRVLAAIFVSFLPWTWFVAGHAFQFGFYNGTIALVLLLSAWLAWLEVRISPLPAVATLALATVALLATWAPLAAITAGLTGVAIVSRGTAWWRGLRGRRLVLGSAAILAIPLYGIAVTLPDLRREGGALSADGGIFAILPTHFAVIIAVALGFCTLAAIARRSNHELVGVVIVAGAGLLALGYLVAQRIGLPVLWGYYPAKMAWLVSVLLVVVTTIAIFGWLAQVSAQVWLSLGVLGVGALVALALMAQVPPNRTTMLPPLSVVAQTGLSQPDEVAKLLFSLSAPDEKNLVVRYNQNPGHDLFVNGWLLQLQATSGEQPIRSYAYSLDGSDLEQVCAAAGLWGDGVVIHTRSSTLESDLKDLCPSPEWKVVLHGN